MTQLDLLLSALGNRQGSRSVRKFAEEIGVDREKLRLVMNRERQPSLDFLSELSAAFSNDPDMLQTILEYSQSAAAGGLLSRLGLFRRKK